MPLILSGGLTPENVAEGIAAVHPWAVDVASGVESAPGIKDPAKVEAFIAGRAAARVARSPRVSAPGRSSTASGPTAASTSPRR